MAWLAKQLKHPWVWAIACFAVGICLSIWITSYLQDINNTKVHALVIKEADRLADAAKQRVYLYDNGLYTVRTHALSNRFQIKRHEFKAFMDSLNIAARFPGARGFGVITRVPLEQEPAFIANARKDGAENFAIRQLKANALDRYVIQYIEPVENNRAALGLDIGSEAKRREAAEDAVDTGEIRITAPITLVQATDKPQQSFLLLLPIYSEWTTPETQALRRQQTKGWAYAPLLMSEILAGIVFDKENFQVQFQDLDTKDRQIFYQSDSRQENNLYTQERVLPVYGRHWLLTLSARQHYINNLGLMTRTGMLSTGILISLIASLLVGMVLFNRRQGSQMATQAAVINAIVNSANDAIIATDLDGIITAWNPGAVSHFGYAASEALGQSILELLVPDEQREYALETMEKVKRNQPMRPFPTRRKSKFGKDIDVLVALVPLFDENKKVSGICATLSNISEIKSIERDLVQLNATLELRVRERTNEVIEAKRSLEVLLNAVPISISQWTRYQTHVVSNLACQRSMNVTAEEIKRMSLRQLWNPLQLERFDELVRGVLAGLAQTYEYKVTRNSIEHTLLLHLVPDFEAASVVGFFLIELDISKLAESQHLLMEAQRETQSLLGAINQQFPYSVTDLAGDIIEVNDQFCLLTGFRRDELLGKNHRIVNSGQHSLEFWKDMWQTVCTGKTWRGEICNRTKTGDLVWFDTVISPTYDSHGKPLHFIALCSDITERKHAEQLREETRRFLGDVVGATAQVSIIATDLEGTITLFNRGAENLLGYKAEELVGKTSPAILHVMDEVVARGKEMSELYNEDIQGFRVFVYKADHGEPETRRWTYVRKDGSTFPISLSASKAFDINGNPIGYVGVAIDISKTLEFEHEIASVRDQLNIATQVAKLGVWTWDVGADQLWWNDRMFDIYEQPKELKESGVGYSHWRDRVHPDDVVATENLLHAAVQGTADYEVVFRICTPSGEKYVLAGAQIDRDEQGVARKVTGINLDVTDQRLLENRLRLAKEAADQASQAKSQFLANMSHEIRTPMNAVLGMLQLMGHTALNVQQEDYVHKAHSAAKSLLDILNDILDFSKIDAGKLQLDPVEFDLEELLRDLSIVLSANHKNKTVEVLFDVDPKLPGRLQGDRLRLQQVLVNLASNALKFTAEGFVKIQISLIATHEKVAVIHFAVEDSGIGISPEQQVKLFQSFSQAEASTTRKFGGTGLGLAISKRLVELMGSELCIDSKVDSGSRFYFDITLPILDATEINVHPLMNVETTPNAKNMRLLIADDNALQAKNLARGLGSYGWQVDVAVDGQDALQKILQAASAEQPYQLALIDWYMPNLNGLETARQIVQSIQPNIPLIALLNGFERQKFTNLANDDVKLFADSIVKPATPKYVAESIWQTVFGRFPKKVVANEKPLKGINLLVVEDNELNRQVARELFESAGAIVSLAEGGVEGVRKVVEEIHAYDLVVMDLQMPDIDGLEATRRIRQDARFDRLPILAMTANVTTQDRQLCLEAGMNDHIGKPIDMQQVVPLVLVLTGRMKASAVTRAVVSDLPPKLLEDSEQVISRFGGNKNLYEKMLAKFPAEVRELLSKYLNAKSSQDLPSAVIAMHSMKGMAATMGAVTLSKLAANLEKTGKAGNWVSDADWTQLNAIVEESLRALGVSATPAATDTIQSQVTASLNPKLLKKLIEQLQQSNMEALETAEQLGQGVQSSSTLKELNLAIQNLEFDKALVLAQSLANDKS